MSARLPDADRIHRALEAAAARLDESDRRQNEPIAVIGMGCRFPGGADDPMAFWRLLERGEDAIGEMPLGRWDLDEYYDPDPDAPGRSYVREGGFLASVDGFDAHRFGISPREAESLDPQQRLLVEVAWETCEAAGLARDQLRGSRTGVFVGVTNCDYGRRIAGDAARIDSYYVTGNTLNAAAGRISYLFGLRGPSLAVDTACSSSLVAVHLACQSLRTRESDLALAGGVNLILSPEGFVALSKARVLSPDGRCKAFDARADGMGRAEGCGVIALKRLSDATRDADTILALVRGSAVNQDGASSGLTVPNGPAQRDVVERALASARVSAGDIAYIEAHGTGTALGDPIELNALGGVFASTRPDGRPLVVGAVKANIGHGESSAGIAGVIKTILCLQHGRIPPQPHFHTPSPHVDWGTLKLAVPTRLMPWPALGGRRVAGVSGFGFSGTNAHVILEEPPHLTQDERPVRRLSVPTPAYQRERYWFTEAQASADADADRLFRTAWVERPVSNPQVESAFRRTAPGPAEAGRHDGQARWLVLADRSGVGADLAALARSRGDEVHLVASDDAAGLGRSVEQLLRASDQPPLRIVHLWSLDIPAGGADAWDRAQTLGWLSALDLVKTAVRSGDGPAAACLWFVTRGAQAVGDAPVAVLAAPLWGFGRVVGLEHPDLFGGLADLDPGARAAAAALIDDIDRAGADNQVAYRGGRRFVPRLQPAATAPSPTVRLDAAATYLVTGGLGDLGLRVGEWMVARGARRLVLAGRRGPSPAVRRRLEGLERAGADVRVVAADLGVAPAVERLLAEADRDGSLRGIVHAAGGLDDGAVLQQDADRFAAAMAGKALGALHLDRLTRGKRLDFFVLFSSIAAVFGSPGQANYAAANALVDALAAERRRQGRVALSIQWGPWAAVGMAARLGQTGRSAMRARGLSSLTVTQNLRLFERSLAAGEATLAAMSLDADRMRSALAGAALPLIDELAGDVQSARTVAPVVESLPADRPGCVAYMAARVRGALHLDERDDLPTDRPLPEIGVDSIMATELRNQILREVQVDIPIARFLEGATVESLAELAWRERATGLGSPAQSISSQAAAARPARIPLSFAQQRLWFLRQLQSHPGIYHVPACAWIDGPLDAEALGGSLARIAARHESLRTTFIERDGEPEQRIGAAGLSLSFDDFSGRSDPAGEAIERAGIFAREPFDLERGPLARGLLVKVAPERHLLALSFHHIVADAWSMGVLLRELAAHYGAAVTGRQVDLPALEYQYPDFAIRQRDELSADRLEPSLAFWRSRLSGVPDDIALPFDRPRPAVPSHQGAIERSVIDPVTAEALRQLASRRGATLFQVLLAAFQLLLHRYSGQERFAIGSPTAGRSRPELEPLIGFFVNTLVIRGDLEGDPTFLELLDRVKAETLEAYAHEAIPFEAIVHAAAPARSLSRNPVFQVMFALQPAPFESLSMNGLELTRQRIDLGVAKFDLYLSLEERTDRGLVAEWEFTTELFDAATVRRMSAHFALLLGEVSNRPDGAISRFPLLTPEEQHRVVFEWNRTDADWPRDRSLVDLVAEQVARTPEAIAAVDRRERWTYAELDRRANRIAHFLRRRGAGPDARVGICLDRSCGMLAAVLGVLKSGAAYVPIDPQYPSDRIAFLVDDASMGAILTQSSLAPLLPGDRVPRIGLDAEDAMAHEPDAPIAAGPRPDHAAYVIYTSGSTGRPKGVVVEHKNAVALLSWARGVFTREDLTGTLASTSLSFDLSVFELLLPLVTGGTVVIADNVFSLASHPAAREVTLVNTVPSAAATLLDSSTLPRSVRVVNLAGEPLTAGLVDRLYALGHVAHVYDLYGPSETTTYSTWARREPGGRETIGRPIANTRAYVLDAGARPVPIGVVGEICVGGAGVSRGYLDRAELTSERYVPDPFHGGRMYRTGDLGRFRPDGSIEYLGRADHQVKIRGFRIELGEIDAALARVAGVRAGVVTARDDGAGGKRLVGYFVGARDIAAVRASLLAALPAYLVPSAFVRMDALPMTPNGKIDRRALPAPDADQLAAAGEYVPPRTPDERTLCRIWADVLRLDRAVGATDNFFEIGGDSMLAIRVVSRAREAGLIVTPALLFEHQTAAALAGAASRIHDLAAEAKDVDDGELPLTPIQRWYLDRDPRDAHHFNQWVLLDVPTDVAPEVLKRAIETVVARHDVFRLRFARTADGWRQWRDAGPARFTFEQTDIAGAAGLHASLDLASGPLGRAALFTNASGRRQLLLTVHHLVVDAVSWSVLLEEIVTACGPLSRGATPTLPARTASFGQCAAHAARTEPLPAPGEFGTFEDSDRVEGMLTEEETRRLIEAVPRAFAARADEALLAAAARALSEWSGRPRHIVDVEGHGRDRTPALDVSRTVGWLTTIYRMVLDSRPGADSGTLIKSIKEARRAAARTAVPDAAAAELSFNYLGQVDRLLPDGTGWSIAGSGLSASPAQRRPHPLAMSASVTGGRLVWDIEFNRGLHDRSAIERVSTRFADLLRELVAYCELPETGGYTPSDFPDAALTQSELDAIVAASPGFHRNLQTIDRPSPVQEGILFHTLMADVPDVYVTQVVVHLEGQLDERAFAAAWNEVISRHAALRTGFVRDRTQQLLRVVLRRAECPFQALDWRGEDRLDARLERLLEDDRRRRFDLASAPLLRVVLIRTRDDRAVCVWTLHHAILDGWSVAIVLREVAALYGGYDRYDAYVPAPAAAVDAAERFWREEVGDWREPLDMAFADAPAADSPVRGERRLTVPGDAVARLNECARRHHLTLHTLLQGAWALLVARHTDRDDVLVGGVVSGRAANTTGIESAVGLFIRTVPVRVQIPRHETVRDWLQRLQARQVQREEHAHLPLVRIHELSGLSRAVPLFDTLLVYENYPVDEALRRRVADLDVGGVRVIERPHYPLTVVVEGRQELALTAIFDGRRFAVETIDGVLERYTRLLTALAEQPAVMLSGLSVLNRDETQRILVEWNATDRAYPRDRTVVDLFEEQVARQPDRIAITFEGEGLTYAELDRRANRLAHALQARGVGPDQVVALAIERSLELVVALLGILKAGGAYAPIDLAQPDARRRLTIDDLETAFVLDADQVRSADGPSTPPPRRIGPDNLAYVIYTSGSTGTPKGAMNTHAGLSNRLLWMQNAFSLAADDVVVQKTPYGFDVSVWEFFWPLIAGARMVVARPDGHLDRDYLVSLIERERITTIHFVPSMLQLFLEAKGLARCNSLRRVIASGEALAPDLARRCRDTLAAGLYNLYGPTEAAVDVSWWPVPVQGPIASVPIGHPVANTQLYVLDRGFQPVPPGVPGELYIGGVQVGRGYWQRPGLTADRFVPNPFAPGRLYRTGDAARHRPDGAIEFLGRLDHQVKIRGVRIEPGEIEAVLRADSQVADAVVVAQEQAGDRRLAAYCVRRFVGADLSAGRLRAHLRAHLPETMVPSSVVALDAIPRLSNGKVDRRSLPDPVDVSADDGAGRAPQALTDIERTVAEAWREVLGVERVGFDQNFFDVGGHSLKLLRVHGRLQERYGSRLRIIDLFEHPTIRATAHFLGGEPSPPSAGHLNVASGFSRTRHGPPEGGHHASIAVIGMAGRVPGARSVDEFWRNLAAGTESIATFTDDAALIAAGEDPVRLQDPQYVRAYGALDDVDCFDAEFFEIPPSEAEVLDPQQRVFLETAWEAIERAGYDPARLAGPVGVFAGAGMNTYALRHIQPRRDVQAAHGAFALLIASDKDYLPTRVSYKLNLTGPSVNVQTACSTSLVAIAMACESLRRGDCRAALAGGVTIKFPQRVGYVFEEGMIFSPDGHSRTFDARAEGVVAGSGVGVVVLKRLEDALADGDHVHAVIRGIAINNDGAVKVGYTAPSVEGQARVITEALTRAGVSPRTIGYVEAHGTATPVGDPIEIAGLSRAWTACADEPLAPGSCAIGSVKTNVGHLDAAAGVIGFIKAVLSIERGQIPPSLHFERPHPDLALETSPFFVNDKLSIWPAGDGPRRAAVSSFGLGGTNAHAILEEAPATESVDAARSPQACHLMAVSARTPAALDAASRRLADALEADAGLDLGDVSYTLLAGRRGFARRRALVARDRADAIALLRGGDPARVIDGVAQADRPVVFMFSGHGAQYPGMAKGLYQSEAAFRDAIDRAAEVLAEPLACDVRHVLFDADASAMRPMAVAQPATFALQYALAALWDRRGVKPAAMIGHSAGEYVAACLAGVFSFEDALRLMATRGRLLDRTPPGAMLAVPLPENELALRLPPGVTVAVITAPAMCVVAGPVDAVAACHRALERDGIDCQPVDVSVAAHSPLMAEIVDPFEAAVAPVNRRAPTRPFISNVTGTWITAAEAIDAKYWARHLRAPVRFGDGVAELLSAHPTACFLEVGPGRALAAPVRRHPARTEAHPILTTLRHAGQPDDDVAWLMSTVAQLWVAGVAVDTDALAGRQSRRRVPLPTYPFERKRYFIEPPSNEAVALPEPLRSGADLLHVPTWQRSVSVAAGSGASLRAKEWLVLGEHAGLAGAVATALRRLDATVLLADSEQALTSIRPDAIVDVRPAGRPADLERSFHAPLRLAQAFADREELKPCRLAIVTSGAYRVTGDETLDPIGALALGLVRVLPQEDERIQAVQIDLSQGLRPLEDLAQHVIEETDASADAVVAYRHGLRWSPSFTPHGGSTMRAAGLRDGGTYVITGGVGGVGLELASGLARSVNRPRLVLVARSADEARHDAARRRLSAEGAEVRLLAADVSDRQSLERAFRTVDDLGWPVDGIIHAAGIPGGGTIRLRTRESVDREFEAKVSGSVNLYDLARDRSIGFLLLCSSTSSITGGFGSVAYTAGCAFQDAFADACEARRTRDGSGPRVQAIDWSRWQGVGMAKEVERLHHQLTGEPLTGGLSADEGRRLLTLVVGRPDLARVLVSAIDPARLEREGRAYQGRRAEQLAAPERHARPEIGTAYEAPRTETETAIAAIWREMFGLDRIGVFDNFLALGGDSLLATRTVSRLRRELAIALPIRALYVTPTIAELARHVDAVRWAQQAASDGANVSAATESGVV